jgi:hypothetical protein
MSQSLTVESKLAEANTSGIFGLFVPGPAKEKKKMNSELLYVSESDGRVEAGGGQNQRHIRIIRPGSCQEKERK